MFFLRHISIACVVAAVCVFAVTLTDAATTAARTTSFTFSTPIGLPGVVLPPGAYIFEIANPGSAGDVVRVFDRKRSTIYLGALTRRTTRQPSDGLDAAIVLGEARPSVPRRVQAWYTAGHTSGHEFLYLKPHHAGYPRQSAWSESILIAGAVSQAA